MVIVDPVIEGPLAALNELAWYVFGDPMVLLLAWFIGMFMFIAIMKGIGVVLRR